MVGGGRAEQAASNDASSKQQMLAERLGRHQVIEQGIMAADLLV